MKPALPGSEATLVTVEDEWQRLAHCAGYKVATLSEVAGVSVRTLQRHFRSCYGVTVSDWLKSVRLREAGKRLRAGGRVKEVALELGYKQLSHFSREFKRAYGTPPTRSAYILNSGPR
jgi:AraC-like DNA-binding protein